MAHPEVQETQAEDNWMGFGDEQPPAGTETSAVSHVEVQESQADDNWVGFNDGEDANSDIAAETDDFANFAHGSPAEVYRTDVDISGANIQVIEVTAEPVVTVEEKMAVVEVVCGDEMKNRNSCADLQVASAVQSDPVSDFPQPEQELAKTKEV